MSEIVLGLGDHSVSKTLDSIIKTYALGSCVALIVYDVDNRIAGMVHVVLPKASLVTEKERFKPGYFADTGVEILMRAMKNFGSTGRVMIKLVGGAQIMDPNYKFNVGKRNILATKKYLWTHRLAVLAEDLGGKVSRTVQISVNTGQVIISNPGIGHWKI